MTELLKPKESLVKMLLSTPSYVPILPPATSQVNPMNNTNTPNESENEGATKLITYFQSSSTGDKETDRILMDHSYCRPWNWRPEQSFIRPTKCLFVWKARSSKHSQPLHSNSANIDVVSVPPTPTPIYDVEKAKNLMEECERHAGYARIDDDEDWEERVSKLNWNSSQNKIFSSMVKILNSDRMARLTYSGTWNEPILRRTVIEKSVQRVRTLMASISWDLRLTQWLHNILIENLSMVYLGAYFDILQTLKSKLPTFVEKMIFGPNAASRVGAISNESLFPLLKRAWDPVASSLIQDKPKKLPGNPVFIIAPTSPSIGPNFSKRLHKWTNLLTSLAHVITVNAHVGIGTQGRNTTLPSCADQMLASLRSKIQEVRADCPNRPIVLVGFNAGAGLCVQAAGAEHATALVCLGFPLLTAEGRRGEPEDALLETPCPVVFVVGQNSHRTSREDMEDLRERMRVETGLVVVGSADDYLRMSKSKKRSEGITQSIVDRCILDEIGDFVGSILHYPSRQVYGPPVSYANEHPPKRMKVERIRNNSNGSSIESEPPSPQPMKLTRPVGRPPGSGKKKPQYGPPLPCKSPPPSPRASPGLSDTVHPQVQPATDHSVPSVPGHYKDYAMACNPSQLQPMAVISSRSILTGGHTLSNLLQKDNANSMRTVSTSSGNTTIKVLENIPITSGTKMISSGGRTVDLSKVTLVNTATGSGGKSSIGNVVVLSDGTKCIRNTNNQNMLQSVKTIGSPNMMLPIVQNRLNQKNMSHNSGVTKLVPTRRQITTGKPRQSVQNLAPPSLTTADILDLPIIFADNDSSLLSTTMEDSQVMLTPRKQGSKYVVINKQTLMPSTSSQNLLKRPSSSVRNSGQKYARIIINQNQLQEADDGKRHVLITNQKMKNEGEFISISPKKIETCSSLEFVDLENELKTNTVPKPIHTTVVSAQSIKNKPDIKHFSSGSRNVTLRVPISVGRSSTSSRIVTTDASQADNVYVLNRSVVNRKRSMKTPDFMKQRLNYRLENVYDEELLDEPDVEK